MTNSPDRLWRHILTATAGGPHGSGFRTIASAIEDEEIRNHIEQALEDAAEVAPRERVYQARTLPALDHMCLLSRLQPKSGLADGRRGNYWAESVLVPMTWLEQGHWDLAQAFEQIIFTDAKEIAEQEQGVGDIPENEKRLQPEELQPLAQGPLKRLALLRNIEAGNRRRLLAAVVRQFRDQYPVYVVRPKGMDATEFERLMLMLPLLLPPCRRKAFGGHRPIHLRTLGFAKTDLSLPIDILGVSADQIEDVGREPGTTVNLDPGLKMQTRKVSGYGEEYVHWLAVVIHSQRWDDLESCYLASKSGGHDPIEAFKMTKRKKPVAKPTSRVKTNHAHTGAAANTSTAQTSEFLPQAQALWRMRERNEKEAAALRKQVHDEVRQLKETLKKDFESQKAALANAGETHLKDLGTAAKRWQQEIERQSNSAENPKLQPAPVSGQGTYGRAASTARTYLWEIAIVVVAFIVLSLVAVELFWNRSPEWASNGSTNIGRAGNGGTQNGTAQNQNRSNEGQSQRDGGKKTERSNFDSVRPDKKTAWLILNTAILSDRSESGSLWLAWSSASISAETSCALLQMALGTAVDSYCGTGTNKKLDARLKEIGHEQSTSKYLHFFEYLFRLDDKCISSPLTLNCLPTTEQTTRLVTLAQETAEKIEGRIERRREKGEDIQRELEIQLELQHLILKTSPELLDRLREVPDFLLKSMLELAAELCPKTVSETRDQYDHDGLQQCLTSLANQNSGS